MTQPQVQPPADATTVPPATGQEPNAAPPATPPATDVPVDVLRANLTKANAEAANYRTKLREAEAKLSGAKTVEEFEAATNELKAANSKLERELLVATVGKGLPDELAALLKGDTEAELLAHAAVLRKFAPAQEAPPEKLGGGLNANEGGDDFDPAEVARMARYGRL